MSFQLLAQNVREERIRIGVFADIQYKDVSSSGNRHYRESLAKVHLMIQHLNQSDLDFLVDLGDRIDGDYESFTAIEAELNKRKDSIYFVPGNHDYAVDNPYKKEVTRKSGSRKGYHRLSKTHWDFIFLNGMAKSSLAHPPFTLRHLAANHYLSQLKRKQAPNAYDWNGGLGRKQTRWLEKQLNEARLSKKNLIIFCHQPLFPGNPHNLWEDQKILQLLSQYPGQIWWISGHDHRGGYQKLGQVHLLTLHGMVEGSSYSYGIIEIEGSNLHFQGYGNQVNLPEITDN